MLWTEITRQHYKKFEILFLQHLGFQQDSLLVSFINRFLLYKLCVNQKRKKKDVWNTKFYSQNLTTKQRKCSINTRFGKQIICLHFYSIKKYSISTGIVFWTLFYIDREVLHIIHIILQLMLIKSFSFSSYFQKFQISFFLII